MLLFVLHNICTTCEYGKRKSGNNSGYIVGLTPPLILGDGSCSVFCLRFSSSSLRYLFRISLMSFVIPYTLKKRMICNTPKMRSTMVRKSIIILELVFFLFFLFLFSFLYLFSFFCILFSGEL